MYKSDSIRGFEEGGVKLMTGVMMSPVGLPTPPETLIVSRVWMAGARPVMGAGAARTMCRRMRLVWCMSFMPESSVWGKQGSSERGWRVYLVEGCRTEKRRERVRCNYALEARVGRFKDSIVVDGQECVTFDFMVYR